LGELKLGPLLRLPPGALGILREIGRHILRRPVVGFAIAAKVPDGRWLLIRRGDTGTWAPVGGTLEWGETFRDAIPREVMEEAGAKVRSIGRLVGVFSRPDRDLRFHAVTIFVECEVELPSQPPMNPMEITEVGLFSDAEIPADLAMGMSDLFAAARRGGAPVIE
jgi:8-oxo-dGTP diphosphatase